MSQLPYGALNDARRYDQMSRYASPTLPNTAPIRLGRQPAAPAPGAPTAPPSPQFNDYQRTAAANTAGQATQQDRYAHQNWLDAQIEAHGGLDAFGKKMGIARGTTGVNDGKGATPMSDEQYKQHLQQGTFNHYQNRVANNPEASAKDLRGQASDQQQALNNQMPTMPYVQQRDANNRENTSNTTANDVARSDATNRTSETGAKVGLMGSEAKGIDANTAEVHPNAETGRTVAVGKLANETNLTGANVGKIGAETEGIKFNNTEIPKNAETLRGVANADAASRGVTAMGTANRGSVNADGVTINPTQKYGIGSNSPVPTVTPWGATIPGQGGPPTTPPAAVGPYATTPAPATPPAPTNPPAAPARPPVAVASQGTRPAPISGGPEMPPAQPNTPIVPYTTSDSFKKSLAEADRNIAANAVQAPQLGPKLSVGDRIVNAAQNQPTRVPLSQQIANAAQTHAPQLGPNVPVGERVANAAQNQPNRMSVGEHIANTLKAPKPGHPLDTGTAQAFLKLANGSKQVAMQLAKAHGWSF